jgi:hypothetical protein
LKLLTPYRRYQHPHVVASLIGRQFSICGIEAAQEGYFPNASPVGKTDVLEVAPLHFSGSKFTLSIIDHQSTLQSITLCTQVSVGDRTTAAVPSLFALRKSPRILPTDNHTRILIHYNWLPTNASRSTL